MSDTPPVPGDTAVKIWLNAAVAAALTLLSAWMTAADFSHRGDLLFQTSASLSLALMFLFLLSGLSLVLAIFPKRMILGLNLLFLCRFAYGFPLSIAIGSPAASRAASVLMLVTSLAYLVLSLKRALRLPGRPWVGVRHSLTMAASLGLIVLLGIPLWILGVERGSRGLLGDYTRFSFSGVALKERVLRKDGQDVHLVGMMHVGEGAFYRELDERMSLPPEDGGKRLVLTEGVSDSGKILPEKFASGETYSRVATSLGIEAQQELGPAAGPDTAERSDHPRVTWRNADIDVSELAEPHRDLLVTLLTALSSGPYAAMLSPELAEIDGSDMEDLFKNGLIGARNDVLMARFDELGTGFSEVYIPWGAAHLPDIERRLLDRGYVIVGETTRPIVNFWK